MEIYVRLYAFDNARFRMSASSASVSSLFQDEILSDLPSSSYLSYPEKVLSLLACGPFAGREPGHLAC